MSIQSENKNITLYSQPGCPTCHQVKGYLESQGFAYRERNVAADDAALEDLHSLGFRATPLTVVEETPILGFNRKKFEVALGLAS